MADPAKTPPPGDDSAAITFTAGAPDIGPAIEAVRRLVEDHTTAKHIALFDPLTGDSAPAYICGDGIARIDPGVFEGYAANPRFRHGTAQFTQIESLIGHVNRFKDEDSVLFAIEDRTKPSITAVIDYHRAGTIAEAEARFGKHRAVFPFPLSDEWTAWQDQDKKPMAMADFAAFLEDRIVDVLDMIPGEDSLPEDMQKFVNAIGGRIASPSRLLELSVGLKVHEKSNVSEAVNLATGEAQIQFVSEHVDGSGAPLKVPNLFLIGIPVFKNGQFYRLAARLRYRKTPGGLAFWYELWRADRVFDHAFRDGCERARVETDLPLLFGTPE